MKVQRVELTNYKRFTHLVIEELREDIRLVVLVGPNGSGKSSLIEAFNHYSIPNRVSLELSYYSKGGVSATNHWQIFLDETVNITFHGHGAIAWNSIERRTAVYVRTAYRNEADFSINQIGAVGEADDDASRPTRMTNNESRVSSNYQRLAGIAIKELFSGASDTSSVRQVRERLLGKIRDSMSRVFDDLILVGLGDITNNGTFTFRKGLVSEYRYTNLSAGEKSAFDLLLDFVVKTEVFRDTVYCLDEPETHMHSSLQGRLLRELYQLLPEYCQLWIATHSVGMVKEAFRLQRENSNTVAFLNFGNRDFDTPVVMRPEAVNRALWQSLFEVVIEDLSSMLAPSMVYICEGARLGVGRRNPEFDASIFRTIFSEGFPDVAFISGGGASEIDQYVAVLQSAFTQLFRGVQIYKIFDRDDRSDGEIADAELENGRVLRRRDIENYLWDDEILNKLCESENRPEMKQAVIAKKNELMTASISRGNPNDDVKSIGGELTNYLKRELQIRGRGNTKEEFCKSVLAPLVTADTSVYTELRTTIFGS